MHDSVVEGFREVIQDVKTEGELTREAIRQTMSHSGERVSFLPRYVYNGIDITYQKYVSVMPPTRDLTPAQGARNA